MIDVPLGPEPVVLLAHAPPDGTKVAGQGCDYSEMDTATVALQLPAGSIVLSGHQHHPSSWHDRIGRAVCFNPGYGKGVEAPNRILINTDRQTAFFESVDDVYGPIQL